MPSAPSNGSIMWKSLEYLGGILGFGNTGTSSDSREAQRVQKTAEKKRKKKARPPELAYCWDSDDEHVFPRECSNCDEILKRPAPCTCTLCGKLNFLSDKEEEDKKKEKKKKAKEEASR